MLNTALNIGAAATSAASFIVRGSASTLSGDLASGQSVLVQGSNAGGNATLTAANEFTNAGNITLESIDSTYNSHLTVTSGALTNAASSASAVAQVMHEAGYQMDEVPTRPHPDKIRSFERAKPNQLWQTDLFTFVLKRQNRRMFLVAFMDAHSRFIVSYGLHASQSSALVLDVLARR